MRLNRIFAYFAVLAKAKTYNKKINQLSFKSKIFIRNGNLRFEDKEFNMDLYLFNPSINMKSFNSFTIN